MSTDGLFPLSRGCPQEFKLNESGVINASEIDLVKKQLGKVTASKIENGSLLGLGTGTTAVCFIEALA